MRSLVGSSESQRQRSSRIPWSSLRAVLFDWAGTTVDHGSLAPVEVVRQVFQEFGIGVTEAEARQPMGKAKIDHLREVLAMPKVLEQWHEVHKFAPDEEFIQNIYRRFLELQKTVLAEHADLIPGVTDFVAFLREYGIKIGSTTGYTRELMEVLLPLAAKAGYSPDVTVCSDEVSVGRPAPWSNFRAAELLAVYPMHRILAIDDSVAGIQAAKNAGCFAIAVTTTGNPLGKSLHALERMDTEEVSRLHQQAEKEFYSNGADLVVESIVVLHQLWGHNDSKFNCQD